MKTEIFEKIFYIHLKQKSQKMLLRVTLKKFLTFTQNRAP